MKAIPKLKLVEANSGLFADSDDGMENEDINEACFGKSKIPR